VQVHDKIVPNKRISELKKYLNIFLALVVFSSLYTLYTFYYTSFSHNAQYTNSISYETFKYGLLKCEEIKRIKPDNNNIQNRKTNPRHVPGTKNVLLQNARILD